MCQMCAKCCPECGPMYARYCLTVCRCRPEEHGAAEDGAVEGDINFPTSTVVYEARSCGWPQDTFGCPNMEDGAAQPNQHQLRRKRPVKRLSFAFLMAVFHWLLLGVIVSMRPRYGWLSDEKTSWEKEKFCGTPALIKLVRPLLVLFCDRLLQGCCIVMTRWPYYPLIYVIRLSICCNTPLVRVQECLRVMMKESLCNTLNNPYLNLQLPSPTLDDIPAPYPTLTLPSSTLSLCSDVICKGEKMTIFFLVLFIRRNKAMDFKTSQEKIVIIIQTVLGLFLEIEFVTGLSLVARIKGHRSIFTRQ